ncbi:hypothetical protein MC45_16945 [Sphingomonas taxi]|uniref:Uncharacterized protein n=1 Tax=Sphingomonas taxi TaxID=1549858 RepID=A0A097EJN3_9SPHN|nr:hypothetical protein MC45_16945 [Sphingomonas taxi]
MEVKQMTLGGEGHAAHLDTVGWFGADREHDDHDQARRADARRGAGGGRGAAARLQRAVADQYPARAVRRRGSGALSVGSRTRRAARDDRTLGDRARPSRADRATRRPAGAVETGVRDGPDDAGTLVRGATPARLTAASLCCHCPAIFARTPSC